MTTTDMVKALAATNMTVDDVVAAMAVAGRVAVVPKGEYNLQTLYERLDMVRFNNCTYIAKKDNKGILPTNEEYWMLSMTGGATSEEAILFLPAGETRLDFEFNEIKNEDTITVQTNKPTVNYTNLQVSGNTVTVFFDAQSTGIYVRVTVSEKPINSDTYIVTETKVLAAGETSVVFDMRDIPYVGSAINIQTDNPRISYTDLKIQETNLVVMFDTQATEIKVRAVISDESV